MQGDTNEYVKCTRKTIQRNNALAPSDEPRNLPEWRKRDARRAVATKTARRESVRDHRAVLALGDTPGGPGPEHPKSRKAPKAEIEQKY